mgnify:CR=1 FL=1
MNINQSRINELESHINNLKTLKNNAENEIIRLKRLTSLSTTPSKIDFQNDTNRVKLMKQVEFWNNAIIRNQLEVDRLKEGRLTASQESNIRLAKARDVLDPKIPKRLEKGLIEEFSKRNPITNTSKTFEVFFYPEYYQLTIPKYSTREAILKGKSYSSRLYNQR